MQIKQIFLILTLSVVLGITIGLSLDTYAQTPTIPNWIKHDAELWANGSISDKEFAMAIGWLVQHKIISANVETLPDGSIYVADNLNIPGWIKNDAGWWADGQISDADFISSIEYMVNQKIILFEQPSILTQIEPNPIQIQSKHGSYRPVGSEGFVFSHDDPNGAAFTPNDPTDPLYDLLPTWILKSQNGVDYKMVHYRVYDSRGGSETLDAKISDGVIQDVVHTVPPGTYVFEITSIDGNPPPTDSRIEITIPRENTHSVTPPSTAQTTPSTTNPTTAQTTPSTTNPTPGLAQPGLMPNGQPLIVPPKNQILFNIPSRIIQEATSSSGAIVDFVAATSPPSTLMMCDHHAGTQFPLGNTVVTCTATGPAGSITKSFTVTVQDTTPPAIGPFQRHSDTPDDSGAVVYFTADAIDLVDGPVALNCDHQSGTKFPMGDTVVTCTADDSRGNHASKSFKISITKS